MPIDGDQKSESGGESFETSGWKPKGPIVEVTDLVFKDSLLYCGFCFGGVSKSPSVTQLRIRDLEVPLAEIPEKCLLLLLPGLDKLKAKIAKIIGCSKMFFELVFQTVFLYETGVEVARHKDAKMAPKQFGTFFIQPPSTYTGGEIKVYRKLGTDEEEVIYLKIGANSGASGQFAFSLENKMITIALPTLTSDHVTSSTCVTFRQSILK